MSQIDKPHIRAHSFISMFLALMLGGLVLSVFGILIGAVIDSERMWGFAATAIFITYPIGAIITLLIINKIFKYKGSLPLGITAILFADILILCFLEISHSSNLIYIFLAAYVTAPALLSTLGYHVKTKSCAETQRNYMSEDDNE
jgi:hypothetical protein